ncbi:ABC transporter ATP-binding protein [Streptacidiphilus sp. P02-A3a]|uniref:dipeptide ABC transporter ATP-binding protein n=1 Tax=Streptacidiphilus sp. P02-A3a TaxID=2704468 RepID=UPI0015FCEE26|nr:ABC transporter ATP-binding protein [Streptacidiphilus sp. P02-A3a]QMU69340.1 ABC transporter ATP-binding protein [Streptacidiphilus sp. P02-A3a]
MTDLLRIQDLRVSFATDEGRATAVDGVSLSVAAGEVLALVGESGSGKTVTARSVLGLLPETAATSGRVLLGGPGGEPPQDVLTASPAQLRALRGARAAMVFQEPSTALNPVFTIGWQIAEGLRAHGRGSRAGRRALAIDMLDRVGIPEPHQRVDHYPHQLSGGQKQRAVIAMALVLGSGLIVADEPTTALDVTVQAEILDLLDRCRTDFGAAVLLITHNMGVVADLADRVAVMRAGRIVEQAPVRALFAAPEHPYTRELLAAVPDFGRARTPVPAPANARVPAPVAPGPEAERRAGPAVRASGLVVDYPGRLGVRPFRAVDQVSFEIHPGEVLGLVGGSGSGKTTIARAVAGLAAVSGGELTVLGEELAVGRGGRRPRRGTAGSRAGQVGFVFQDPATSFNPLLTIADCVAEPLLVHQRQLGARAIRERVDELLESVRLPRSYGLRHPHELSGGQRQRASLARALALRPQLLIADEPTSALDVSVQAQVLELFRSLQAEMGFASLFVSHDLAVIEQVADRVAVLHQGRLVESGPTAQVLSTPAAAYTRRLIAALPVPDPVRQAARRRAAAGTHRSAPADTTADTTADTKETLPR